MSSIYLFIALVVLYGDVTKRYLSPQLSLLVLYVMAAAILIAMIRVGKKYKVYVPLSKEGQILNRLVLLLIVIYMLQLFTSFTSPFMDGLSHALYMVIPLLYIVIIQKYCPQFDLVKLAHVLFWLMIPVNLVGLVQHFINPDFLISTAVKDWTSISKVSVLRLRK